MSLPRDMLAARCLQYHASPPLSVVRVPVPSPGPNEILVKVTAASLCHTDIAMCAGNKRNEGNEIPQTAGHEPCGTIAKLGEAVEGFKEGDRIGFVNHAGSCEYAIGDAAYTFKLPDKLSDEQAAPLMCAGVTAYAAVNAVDLRPGQWLAVVGCGGVGHLAIQFAKALGIKVVGLDVRASSLALAKKVGADSTIDSSTSSAVDDIFQATNGGVHATIVLAESQSAMELAADASRKHAKLCLVAAPPDPWKISPLYVIHKDLKFTGSLLATPQQCRDMLKMVEEHEIHIETKTYPFDQVNEMIADAKTGKLDGRLVLKF